MADALPVSLFLSRRALCPGCGAPLQLEPMQPAVDCGYCGCRCSVERRLRTFESELVPGTAPSEVARKRPDFTPAYEIADDDFHDALCPGCGSQIKMKGKQEIAECSFCGSKAKFEQRLVPSDEDPCDDAAHNAELAEFASRDHTDFKKRLSEQNKEMGRPYVSSYEDLLTDHYLCAVLSAPDDTTRANALEEIRFWHRTNTWRECMFTRLLREVGSYTGNISDKAYEFIENVARAPWSYDEYRAELIRRVVRSASRVLYSPDVPAELCYRLATGQPNAMLKLMLDVAEWALDAGHEDKAIEVLAGTSRALDKSERFYHMWRDKVDPEVLGEIVLYRLLYLPDRMLAWALEQIPRWQVTDYRVMVRFIDDCAFEKPELIPVIRDARICHQKPAATFREYLEHLKFLDELLSPQAREYGMYLYIHDARNNRADPDTAPLAEILPRLLSMCEEEALHKHAGYMLAHFIRMLRRQELPEVHTFIRAHGDKLPPIAWWAYRAVAPSAEIPTEPGLVLPYTPPAKFTSDLQTRIADFPATHEREWRFMAEEKRRAISEENSAEALDYAASVVERIRSECNDWKPPARALRYYRTALRKLRLAGDKANFGQDAVATYELETQLTNCWVEFEQTRDPRYKDYIERMTAALDAAHEKALTRRARTLAKAYARKSLLGRLIHRIRGLP